MRPWCGIGAGGAARIRARHGPARAPDGPSGPAAVEEGLGRRVAARSWLREAARATWRPRIGSGDVAAGGGRVRWRRGRVRRREDEED